MGSLRKSELNVYVYVNLSAPPSGEYVNFPSLVWEMCLKWETCLKRGVVLYLVITGHLSELPLLQCHQATGSVEHATTTDHICLPCILQTPLIPRVSQWFAPHQNKGPARALPRLPARYFSTYLTLYSTDGLNVMIKLKCTFLLFFWSHCLTASNCAIVSEASKNFTFGLPSFFLCTAMFDFQFEAIVITHKFSVNSSILERDKKSYDHSSRFLIYFPFVWNLICIHSTPTK